MVFKKLKNFLFLLVKYFAVSLGTSFAGSFFAIFFVDIKILSRPFADFSSLYLQIVISSFSVIYLLSSLILTFLEIFLDPCFGETMMKIRWFLRGPLVGGVIGSVIFGSIFGFSIGMIYGVFFELCYWIFRRGRKCFANY